MDSWLSILVETPAFKLDCVPFLANTELVRNGNPTGDALFQAREEYDKTSISLERKQSKFVELRTVAAKHARAVDRLEVLLHSILHLVPR